MSDSQLLQSPECVAFQFTVLRKAIRFSVYGRDGNVITGPMQAQDIAGTCCFARDTLAVIT